ncbi:MAG TPA: DUF1127 domain-containing protein [Dongiaceae bacterium]|nr:DUF1127 domain-containing protein [Dongiaceae bacterium]
MAMIAQQLVDSHGASKRQAAGRPLLKLAGKMLIKSFETVLDWQARSRERRQLLGLSDQALKDIGVNRADAEFEGSKPSWRR